MKKLIFPFMVIAIISLAGCGHTISGVGQDINAMGSGDSHTVVKQTTVESPVDTTQTTTETTSY